MYKTIKKVYKAIETAEKYMLGGIFIILTLVIFYNIVIRAVGLTGLTWQEEFSRAILVGTTFIGGCVATGEGRLTKLSLVPESLPKRAAAMLTVIVNILSAAFMLWLSKVAIDNLVKVKAIGMSTTTLGIQIWVIYLFVTIGICGIALRMLLSIYDAILAFRKAEKGAGRITQEEKYQELQEKGE